MDPKYFVGIAVALIMGWFAVGIIYNLRLGDRVLKWMQGGLPKVGERTSFRWLGSSVAELSIEQAKKPFKQLTTLVFLAPRDVPWLWAFAAARGRRDTLIFRGMLAAQPKVDLELVDPSSYTGRMGIAQVTGRGWESEPCGDLVLYAPKGYMGLARSTAESLIAARQQLSPAWRRFALRRGSPHFEAHIALPDTKTRDAGEFFESLRSLARAVSHE